MESEIFHRMHVMGTVHFVINRLVHEECTMNFVDFHCMHVKCLYENADVQRDNVTKSDNYVARHRIS